MILSRSVHGPNACKETKGALHAPGAKSGSKLSKLPALQTLARQAVGPEYREAFGVRAACLRFRWFMVPMRSRLRDWRLPTNPKDSGTRSLSPNGERVSDLLRRRDSAARGRVRGILRRSWSECASGLAWDLPMPAILLSTLALGFGLLAWPGIAATVALVVDTTQTGGELDLTRYALGQGELSDQSMIDPHVDQIAQLQPQTIRLFVQE